MFMVVYKEGTHFSDITYYRTMEAAKKHMPSCIYYDEINKKYDIDFSSKTEFIEEEDYLYVHAFTDEVMCGKPFFVSYTVSKVDFDPVENHFYRVIYNPGYARSMIYNDGHEVEIIGYANTIEEVKEKFKESLYIKSWEIEDFSVLDYSCPFLSYIKTTIVE